MIDRHGIVKAIGLMSGTSLDGIDVAWIATDGVAWVEPGPALTIPYDRDFRAALRAVLGSREWSAEVRSVEQTLTRLHAEAVENLRSRHALPLPDLIGFHGHTILHEPGSRRTWQLGDAQLLADLVEAPVIADFRSSDVAAGGQGAPLVPIYHRALAADLPRPVAILNVGGVANVTWIGEAEDEVLSFDTGPGNAPSDDWALHHTGQPVDLDGRLAFHGVADHVRVEAMLADPYFDRAPPKSIDRDQFRHWRPDGLSPADGAATIIEAVAASVARAVSHFPKPVVRWIVSGGGRRNPALMAALTRHLDHAPLTAEACGLDGDALEAQAFAYLAVRHQRRLPISFPGTTGVPSPMTGGRLFQPLAA